MIYKCHNCGGNVVYDPQRKAMYCPHCEGIDSEDPVPDKSLTNCANCGAPMTLTDYTSAGRCAHCGSYIIFEERVEGQYTPHLILPFQVSREAAQELLKKEFPRRIFAPSTFLSQASMEKMEGVYVPFFMYDYHTNYDYVGKGKKIRTWVSGDTEYTETSIYRIAREMEADFKRVPVDASIAMEDGVMDLMEPYNYQALEDFQMKYMSGFYGERYNQDSKELESRARSKTERDSEELMSQSIVGYASVVPEHRNLSVDLQKTEYALLPIWVYTYDYQGKKYTFHVNGQTGKLIGKMPISAGKVVGYAASIFASVCVMGQLIRMIMEVL